MSEIVPALVERRGRTRDAVVRGVPLDEAIERGASIVHPAHPLWDDDYADLDEGEEIELVTLFP